MEGLLKRISAEGSEAENALRVIAFFDELVENRGSIAALVRSTARLIGGPAGFDSMSGRSSCSFDSIGRPYGTSVPQAARAKPVAVERGFSGTAWILPQTSNHALADLVLERMALAAAIVLGRDTGEAAHAEETSMSRLLDSRNSVDDRRLDAQLLGFRPSWNARVLVGHDGALRGIKTKIGEWARGTGVKATTPIVDAGMCVIMLHDTGEWEPSAFFDMGLLLGVGCPTPVEDAFRSFESARLALKLCSELLGPAVVDYSTLGPVRFLAAVPSGVAEEDDLVRQLVALTESESGRAELVALDAFCSNSSLRTAAAKLHLHHSSLANRLENVARKIGRDLSDPRERFLVGLALQLLRVSCAP